MSDDTVPQFGRSLREDASRVPVAGASRPTSCPTCNSHFSPDGRFCPFDGTALTEAVGWDPSADTLLGSLIDNRYEVLSVIGEGGMGTVYEVKHRALGKRFALKALRKDLTSDGEIAARFIQEARTAAAVSHPGLVEITDFGRLESGQVYFVMELLEGQSLAALLRGGPLPPARGLEIVKQLVHALKAAHDASIVHRDLKPDNVHVGRGDAERDLVKIVDFGLAKVIGSSKLTRSGMVFGTPHYMSPEQAAGEVVDHRADIYALGIVMYEMFTGRVPFEADSYMGVLTKHMYMDPAPPSDVSPEVKELGMLEHVILRCLQKRPSARYDNLAALLIDLDERVPSAAGGHQPSVQAMPLLTEQRPLPLREPGRRRAGMARWPLLVVACAFVLGIALVVALRPRRPVAGAPPVVASSTPSEPRVVPVAKLGPAAAVLSAPAVTALGSGSAQPPARAPVPARKPARPAALPAKKVAGSGSKRPAGSGDIVDPWAH